MTVIEFFGLSRSGKSTQIKELSETLNKAKIGVTTCMRYPRPFKDSGTPERFHENIYQYIMDAIARHHAGRKEYLLIDRGLYDRQILLQEDIDQTTMSGKFADKMLETIIRSQCLIDVPLYLNINPEVSLSRFKKQKQEGLDLSRLNAGMPGYDEKAALNRLEERYDALSRSNRKIKTVDALPPIADVTRNVLEALAEEGIDLREVYYDQRNRNKARIRR